MEINGLAHYRSVIEDARSTDPHWASEIVRDSTPAQRQQLLDALVQGWGVEDVLAQLAIVVTPQQQV